MFGNERFSISVVAPSNFKIRRKEDARTFLEHMLQKGADCVLNDVKDERYYYHLMRMPDGSAHVCHDRKGKDMFQPDFMLSGEEAVKVVYDGRKSINKRFFEEEK